MKSIPVVAAVVCGLGSTPAFAKEGYDLSGLKIGAFAGYESGSQTGDWIDMSADGIIWGGSFGYDISIGRVVIGADAEVGTSSTSVVLQDTVYVGDTFTIEAGREVYAGAKLGVVPVRNMLVYVKLGASRTKAKVAWEYGPYLNRSTSEAGGTRYSVGAEYMVAKNAGLRAEYRHDDLGVDTTGGYQVSSRRGQTILGVFARF